MINNLNLNQEEQVDLRIVEHLDMQNLPESIQNMLSLAKTEEEKDMLLMATLAAASACVPNLYFRYGPTGKKYYANLQCFILASSASGKGIANQALEMMRVVDEQYPMLIAGDSTLPAWYKALEEQGGVGYMHESEGSVITDIWKAGAANYNTALRKAAEHEAISRNRVKGSSEIACPRLSMLLTGTFSQYKALVPSVENGYFSRLLTLVERGSHPFEKSYVTAKSENSAVARQVGQQLLRTYEGLKNAGEREWSLTDAQKERLGEKLETEYRTLIEMLGENFHSAVIRMAVQIERMAMVLSAMRMESGECHSPEMEEESRILSGKTDERDGDKDRPYMVDTIYCSDQDYETAEMIGSKMLMHMAMAYRMIKGDETETMPEVKQLDQRKVVFEGLKAEYDNHELETEGKRYGVSRATIFRWNEKWLEEGLVIRSHRGKYQKTA
ncbi:MAG: DUF3987 domain-containing protein [Paludibacteraceae bacterium]|nr:DUF3987 domain-containing protein [Paludibacteraceae bacterium]